MGSRHLHYTIESPFSQPPPPPPPPPKTNLPMLYYGLIVVGTAAIFLAMYNLIFIKWTSNGHNQQLASRSPNTLIDASRTRRRRSFENLDTFKYKKKEGSSVDKEQEAEGVEKYVECAVCLSIFEEGEDVRILPTCKHSFHAACIDMWLYSHSDCPLCRAQVPVTSSSWCQLQLTTTPEENSREVLLV